MNFLWDIANVLLYVAAVLITIGCFVILFWVDE